MSAPRRVAPMPPRNCRPEVCHGINALDGRNGTLEKRSIRDFKCSTIGPNRRFHMPWVRENMSRGVSLGERMQRITLLNPKGGSGKTTLATNLASYFAGRGYATVLFDYDAQGSSTRWLEVRPSELPSIHGVPAYREAAGATRTWQLRVPAGTERVIVDTPASVAGPRLDDLVRRSDCILIPVLASPIDLDAFMNFALILGHIPRIRSGDARVAVIANRVRRNTRYFKTLQNALLREALGAPMEYVATLRDTQQYVHAGARGYGISELDSPRVAPVLDEWEPLLAWLGDLPNGGNRRPRPKLGREESPPAGNASQGRLDLRRTGDDRNAA